jgi:hypothetical protein
MVIYRAPPCTLEVKSNGWDLSVSVLPVLGTMLVNRKQIVIVRSWRNRPRLYCGLPTWNPNTCRINLQYRQSFEQEDVRLKGSFHSGKALS